MALIITVKADTKGLELKSILPSGLEHGMYDDAYRLQESDSTKTAIVFDPKHIGRGINVDIKDDSVETGLSLPAGKNEISLAFRIAARACKKLGAKVMDADGRQIALGDVDKTAEDTCLKSEAELKDITEKLSEEKGKVVTLFGALNPITINADDASKMDGKLDKLEKFLHNKQMVHAYYSAPQFFQDPGDGSFVGVYNIMVGVDTIMPFEPSVPFYMSGTVPRWFVYVYVSDDMYGYVKFSDFMNKAPRNGFYDATHYFCNLTEDQAEQLIKNYGADV